MSEDKPRYSVKSPSRGGKREGAGRPATVDGGYEIKITVRITAAQNEKLLALADQLDADKAEVMRQALEAFAGMQH